MAITASGAFGLSLEKAFLKTIPGSMEAASAMWCALLLDTATPNFDTHDFFADLSGNEVAAGDGYTAGGMALASFAVTPGSPAAGQIMFDSDNPAWTTSTISNGMAALLYWTTGSTATDQLFFLSDFVTAASSSNGTYTVTVHADGWAYVDYTP